MAATANGSPQPQGENEPPIMAMRLLACGLNAHGQLSRHGNKDLTTFTPLTAPTAPEDVRMLYTGWSETVLHIGSRVVSLGADEDALSSDVGSTQLSSAVGDTDGMRGCMDSEGRLWIRDGSGLQCIADPDGSPLVGHLAQAGNGKIAMTFKQAPNGRLCHVLRFGSFEDLVAWYRDPANVAYDAATQHSMIGQARPAQLVAGTGTFLLRMEGGEVYSWGDPRYSSLGRSIAETPAAQPGAVDALGGLKIKKVACGGWLNAALSEDGACYVWGAGTPGTDPRIKCLRDASSGELVLVELPSSDGEEHLDVSDVAVGDTHIVLLAEGGRVFAVGENKNGQLGLNHSDPFIADWTAVAIDFGQVSSLVCGPKSTYAFATNTEEA